MGDGTAVPTVEACSSGSPADSSGTEVNGELSLDHADIVIPSVIPSIRKNRVYIMALTHVLTKHNYALYILFVLTFFNQDVMNKRASL